MPLNSESIRRKIRDFDFKMLFIEELNWDRLQMRAPVITVDGSAFTLTPIAEKRGFQIFQCSPDKDSKIPDDKLRRKIDRELTKLVDQHLVIFVDGAQTMQTWQWAKREHNKLIALRTESYHRGQTGQRLAEKVEQLFVDLDEEESLFITDVSGRARRGFDVDRVTKRFYDRFKKEHEAFLGFIKGIQEKGDREWYASLMLNRLMFIYFIQKKEFLDGDINYLRNRLKKLQNQKGRNKFHSFYRYFLLRLFHEGLGDQKRNDELDTLLGKVPYLNGGLFDLHDLEKENQEIEIEDKAFEKIFDFFDSYQWHLDDRPLRSDYEINPDVLGYIFEKYINQKQMGAYYTKEDITEYISKNTIVPFLFDAAQKRCPIAFEPDSAMWRLLKENPDRYIYGAVRKGVIDEQGMVIPLPAEIEKGIKDVSKRGGWNKPADESFALPTETWREHVARRKRCLEIRDKLKTGEVHAINDLITYNLDIRQFAQDAIDNCEGVDLLRAFYRVIAGHIPHHSNENFEMGMSVLDPTCGSGAFLFAALNILEPLYEACLSRMQSFVDEATSERKYEDFRRILERVEKHDSRRYFILKSIIIGNLYGVDIMEEATEICKLRLFLKLVAELERPEQIEPLPDIDFNIRAGNTLVGFATYDEAKRSVNQTQIGQHKIQFEDLMAPIDEKAEIAARAYEMFRKMQTAHDMDAEEFHEAKEEVRGRLRDLDEELDRYMAGEYGVRHEKPKEFQAWRNSHQPFHWFVGFYSIMKSGGFDVIIGNPPWVEYRIVEQQYSMPNAKTLDCNNLWAFITERSLDLLAMNGWCGLIVPMSLVCTERMVSIQEIIANNGISWLSNYESESNPGQLFIGVKQNISILLHRKSLQKEQHTTRMYRFFSEERSAVFSLIQYAKPQRKYVSLGFPKSSEEIELQVLDKMFSHSPLKNQMTQISGSPVYVHRIAHYYIKCFDFIPYFRSDRDGVKKSEDYKEYKFPDSIESVVATINSSSFYFYWLVFYNSFKAGKLCIESYPCNKFSNKTLRAYL